MKKINIIVIGAGMYVCGRGTQGYGTVIPAINEWKKKNSGSIGKIFCAATSTSSIKKLQAKVQKLEVLSGSNLDLDLFPKNKDDPSCYKEILSNIEKPACAIIAVPDHLHYTITKDCLEAGLHALVVKPLTPTLEEGQDLANIAENNNLYGAVEFHKRWDKSNLILKDKILSGGLGIPLYCVVEYSQRKSIPTSFFKEWSSETNILQYLGIHYIDLIRFITSAKPIRVMAIGQKSLLLEHNIDTFDSIQCTIEWMMPSNNIFTQTILTNWIDPENSPAMSNQRIKIIGTKGRYEADQRNRGITYNTDDEGSEDINPDFCMQFGLQDGKVHWEGYGIQSITNFLDDILHIENKKITHNDLSLLRPTFKESLISTSIIEAANKSLATNSSWQEIKSS